MRARTTIKPITIGRDKHKNGHSRPLMALIDPGSNHSMIQEDQLPPTLQQEIKLFLADPKRPNNHNIRLHKHSVLNTINGKSINDTITINVRIQIAKWQGDIELVVLQNMANEKFILGADFLNTHNANISYDKNAQKMCLTKCPIIQHVRAHQTTRLKANTEGHIEVEVPHYLNNHAVIVQRFDHANRMFSIANTIQHVKNGRIMLRYVNPTRYNIKIHKGEALAEVSRLDPNAIKELNMNNIHASINDVLQKAKISPNLSAKERESINELLQKYVHAFSQTDSDRGETNLVEHQIKLTTNVPIKQAPYRVPPFKRQIIKDKVQEMIDQGVLEESRSPFAAPVVLIRKKNGEWRFCADYRQLNE